MTPHATGLSLQCARELMPEAAPGTCATPVKDRLKELTSSHGIRPSAPSSDVCDVPPRSRLGTGERKSLGIGVGLGS
jgi:hypothetical protein